MFPLRRHYAINDFFQSKHWTIKRENKLTFETDFPPAPNNFVQHRMTSPCFKGDASSRLASGSANHHTFDFIARPAVKRYLSHIKVSYKGK